MQQLELFGTGITCAHCKQDPGRDPRNGHLWNGFLDADNGQHVCCRCRELHYLKKSLSNADNPAPVAGQRYTVRTTFSEFPLMVDQTFNNALQKRK